METKIRQYSRILIPLPPDQDIKARVKKQVEDTFKIIPEYIETSDFEGYAYSWNSWYDSVASLRYPSIRSFFAFKIKKIIEDWLNLEEEMLAIEWINSDLYEWMNIKRNYDEIFNGTYTLGNSSVIVKDTNDCLRIKIDDHRPRYIRKRNIPELMKPDYSPVWPIFRILARRGYWNEIELSSILRDKLYERIGFKFGEF